MTYMTDVAADNPRLWFKMDETSGTQLVESGSDTYVTELNTSTGLAINQPGVSNTGVYLDGGATAYATHFCLAATFVRNASYEIWVKTADTGTIWRWGPLGDSAGISMSILATGVLRFRRGSSLTMDSVRAINDNQWHHLAVTHNDVGSVDMYIDGVVDKSATGQSMANIGSNNDLYLGDNSTAAILGNVDEFAVYQTILTPAKIAARYAVGNPNVPTPVNVDAVVMTAGSLMTDATAGTFVGGPAMTANATMTFAIGESNTWRADITEDATVNESLPDSNFNTQAFLEISPQERAFLRFAEYPGENIIQTKKLTLHHSEAPFSKTFTIYSVNAWWYVTDIDWNNMPATTLAKTVTVTTTSTGEPVVFDLTGINTINGVVIASDDILTTFDSSNAANPAVRPYVTYETKPVHSENIHAFTATADAVLVNPVVSAITPVTVSAQAMNITAVMPTAAVEVEVFIDKNILGDVLTGFAEMGAESDFAVHVITNALPLEGNAESTDATVTLTNGVLVNALSLTASSVWVQPALINGAAIPVSHDDDAYYQRVSSFMPQTWWRMDDTTGDVVDTNLDDNRSSDPDWRGTYNGVEFGHHDGPNGRQSAHFTGIGYISANIISGGYAAGSQQTTELTFRTSKPNQFLLSSFSKVSFENVRTGEKRITLVDGRLRFHADQSFGDSQMLHPATEFTAFTNVADGEWHHMVIVEYGMSTAEVYLDGRLEIRRSLFQLAGPIDYLGGKPGLPSDEFFVGDMTEMVRYRGYDEDYGDGRLGVGGVMNTEDITRNYYAVMGWKPVEVTPMTATATTPDSKGKGNQKRALFLYWDNRPEYIQDPNYDSPRTLEGRTEFSPIHNFPWRWQNGDFPWSGRPWTDFGGFKVFAQPCGSGMDEEGRTFTLRDKVTDKPRFLDLEEDINLDDYDVLMFKDWPDTSYERDIYEFLPGKGSIDKLVQQIRDANNNGMPLYITNPRLAIDLGIIGQIEFAPSGRRDGGPWMDFRELEALQGEAFGLWDYGSAVQFPWQISGTDSVYQGTYEEAINDSNWLIFKARFYKDTHRNNMFRVRAIVEGLTDIPSYMVKDHVWRKEKAPFSSYGWATKLLNATDGLKIGDEYYYAGPDYDDPNDFFFARQTGRLPGTWAIKPGQVFAGTVVTTFGSKEWLGTSLADNPYKDYPTCVVVEKGEMLNGSPTGARIYVNFSEAFTGALATDEQVIPRPGNGVEWPKDYPPETPEQMEWEFSWTRWPFVNPKNGQENGNNLHAPFQTISHPHWQMNARGWNWLFAKEEEPEGSATVRANAMTVAADIVHPRTTAQHDASVLAQQFTALGSMPKVAEDMSGDADISTLPLTASASITGFGRNVSAEPMLAQADIIESFDMIHAAGEQVTLTLHGHDITLFIKET